MLEIILPQYENKILIENLMLDYNGTLAKDGILLPNIDKLLLNLSDILNIHIVTANTYKTIENRVKDIPCKLEILKSNNQAEAKLKYLKSLNPDKSICIGNGFNDSLMLKEAKIGIAVIQGEGASTAAIRSADIVCFNIYEALELITNPLRIVATLRN